MSVTCTTCGAIWSDGTIMCPDCRTVLLQSQAGSRQYGQRAGAQQYGNPTPQDSCRQRVGDQRATPKMAIASLILGSASLIWGGLLTGAFAIVLGSKAITNFNPQVHKGIGLAKAGRILGVVGCVMHQIAIIFVIDLILFVAFVIGNRDVFDFVLRLMGA